MSNHKGLNDWIQKVSEMTKPARIEFVDGSKEQIDRLFDEMVKGGTAIKLNEKLRPNSYLFRSSVKDVARVESRTLICCRKKEDAGPINNWEDPKVMKKKLKGLFHGCMRGRTMYVIPFSMGPIGGPISKIGVQITDSAYAVTNMAIMARCGNKVLEVLGKDGFFVPCLHSVGYPLADKDGVVRPDTTWPCNPENTWICHFPEEFAVWSFGSGYGGNALLGKKCLALRIASVIARQENWLAEHMLILGVKDPQGTKTYVTAAFPSQCGKTNFAMLTPPPEMEGWNVTCVGDDIAWIKPGPDGRLYAINPENGFFGVAPGTGPDSNPVAMTCCAKNSIFTNVALTDDGDVWWEGMGPEPTHLIDWTGKDWTPGCGRLAAHPNSRFTSPLANCSILDEKWDDPKGVPISIIAYGGRRTTDIPLVYQAFNWQNGVYTGATIASEVTSAAQDLKEGSLRNDPFAMRPFCGYHMGDYINHYLHMGKIITHKPLIFHVNWFRKDLKTKNFLWPGYSQNMRPLRWMVERANGKVGAIESPLGFIPRYKDMDWRGLKFSETQWKDLMNVNSASIKMKTTLNHEELFLELSDKCPADVVSERKLLVSRL